MSPRTFIHHDHWENEHCDQACREGILNPDESPGALRVQTWGVAQSFPAAYVRGLEDEAKRLRAALREARECVAHWAGYAAPYFQTKWNLAGDLAAIDAALGEA